MKKKLLGLIAVLAFSSCLGCVAFAEDTVETEEVIEETAGILDFVEVLSMEKDSEREDLTVDEAFAYAIKNSSSILSTTISLESLEESVDDAQTVLSYSDGTERFTAYTSYLKAKMNFSESETEFELTKEKLYYEIRAMFTEILALENTLYLENMDMENTIKEKKTYDIKYEYNMISEAEYNSFILSYERAVQSLASTDNTLKNAYLDLNVAMGFDEYTQYNLIVEPVMNELEMDTTIEIYSSTEMINSFTMEKAADSIEYYELALEFAIGTDTIESVTESLTFAKMDYSDTSVSLKNTIVSMYESIETLLTNYEFNLVELEALKIDLETATLQYESGMISENSYNQAVYNVAKQEASIIDQIYEYMQLEVKFNNVDLI